MARINLILKDRDNRSKIDVYRDSTDEVLEVIKGNEDLLELIKSLSQRALLSGNIKRDQEEKISNIISIKNSIGDIRYSLKKYEHANEYVLNSLDLLNAVLLEIDKALALEQNWTLEQCLKQLDCIEKNKKVVSTPNVFTLGSNKKR